MPIPPATAAVVVLLAALTVASGSTAPAAPAHREQSIVTRTTITDHDDTDGPLDTVSVAHAVRETGDRARLRYTVRMAQPVEVPALDRPQRRLVAELDTDGRPGAERNITVHTVGEQLRASLISNATREVIRLLPVRLVGQHRLRLGGPRRLAGARRIFWYSYFHRRGHPDCGRAGGYPVTCSDSAPDDGWLRLPRAAWPPSGSRAPEMVR